MYYTVNISPALITIMILLIVKLLFDIKILVLNVGIPGSGGGGGGGSDEDTTSSESEDEFAKPSTTLVVPAAATITEGKWKLIHHRGLMRQTQSICLHVCMIVFSH